MIITVTTTTFTYLHVCTYHTSHMHFLLYRSMTNDYDFKQLITYYSKLSQSHVTRHTITITCYMMYDVQITGLPDYRVQIADYPGIQIRYRLLTGDRH